MMLEMSGAGEYVEALLDDAETLMRRGVLAEDGSSNFSVFLRLHGVLEEEEGGESRWREMEAADGWRGRRLEAESC